MMSLSNNLLRIVENKFGFDVTFAWDVQSLSPLFCSAESSFASYYFITAIFG